IKEPIENQPLPADASPTALSPGYVVDSDPEKDEKDPKEDPADYPTDRGNNNDNESSNNDDHHDDVKKDEEDKEDGSKPLCSKCNYHHDGSCAPKCHQCNRFGHLAHNCRSSTNANTTNIQKGTRGSQKATCYECGNQWHYKRDCPERKNQDHENKIKSTMARGVVHAFGGGKTKKDLNNIKDEIEA
nr:hypothetical protein [Tanacetum cinerariifolium]